MGDNRPNSGDSRFFGPRPIGSPWAGVLDVLAAKGFRFSSTDSPRIDPERMEERSVATGTADEEQSRLR